MAEGAGPVRAVVFDYGHTLIDFTLVEDSLFDCYSDVRGLLLDRAYENVPEVTDLVERVTRGVDRLVQASYLRRSLEELDIVGTVQELLAEVGIEIDPDLAADIVRREHRCMASELHISPANLQVLRDLRAGGLHIGLVSNAHFHAEMMREDIDRLGIAQFIDDAIFSAEIGLRKPHPAIFMKVLDTLDVGPEEAVFVGDRLRDDICGAKSLGMRGVLTHEFRQEPLGSYPVRPDLVIETLPELIPYVLG